jgi:hypothetical protein
MSNLLPSARETFQSKKQDTWMDKTFVRIIVREIQKIDSDIGAFLFPETKTLLFFYKKIIIYKLTLNELNTEEIDIASHVKKVRATLHLIKIGAIPLYDIVPRMVGFNKNKTGKKL